jgi:hypothetical protein
MERRNIAATTLMSVRNSNFFEGVAVSHKLEAIL